MFRLAKLCVCVLMLVVAGTGYAASKKTTHHPKRGDQFYSQFVPQDELEDIARSRTVVVRRGDTLTSIAARYHVNRFSLIRLNNLTPPYDLNVGQIIKLPAARDYKVQRGDTLMSISREFGISHDAIARFNTLPAPYALKVGQTLLIPSPHEAKAYLSGGKKATHIPQSMATKPAGGVKRPVQKAAPKQAVKTAKTARPAAASAQKTAPATSSKKPALPKNYVSYSKPGSFIWPVRGKVVSRFGAKKSGIVNDGVNIAAKMGTTVQSAASGQVAFVGKGLRGYGNLVIVKHPSGWITAYAHLKDVFVKKGEKVGQRHPIGTVGQTGNVDAPQVHFAIRRGRDPVNPLYYLKG